MHQGYIETISPNDLEKLTTLWDVTGAVRRTETDTQEIPIVDNGAGLLEISVCGHNEVMCQRAVRADIDYFAVIAARLSYVEATK